MDKKTRPKPPMQPGKNGGKLNVGNPGNKGGKGRMKSEVRDACTQLFDDGLKKIQAKFKSGELSDRNMISAMEMLGKFGIGTRQEIAGDSEAPLKILYCDPNDI